MPDTIIEVKSSKEFMEDALSSVHADFMTFGGALIMGVTVILTVFFILSVFNPVLDGMQMIITGVLTVISWMYLINRFSENLNLKNNSLEFNCALGKKHSYKLQDISAVRLNHRGWSLNGDFYVLEIETLTNNKKIELGLGPCWHRGHLLAFVRGVGLALNE